MEIDPAEFRRNVELFKAYMLEILREAQADTQAANHLGHFESSGQVDDRIVVSPLAISTHTQ